MDLFIANSGHGAVFAFPGAVFAFPGAVFAFPGAVFASPGIANLPIGRVKKAITTVVLFRIFPQGSPIS